MTSVDRAPLPVAGRLRRGASLAVGWLADRRVPTPLRRAVYGAYALGTGARPAEAQLPLTAYPSLGAFFVRRLRPGLRPVEDAGDAIISPCDGRVQALDRIDAGSLLQAKGRPYAVRELLAGAGAELDLEGAWAVTIYLGPSDYHRVHAPLDGVLSEVRWAPGDRHSVSPAVVQRRARVFSINERAVLRLGTPLGPAFLVMVGALNVGRIRVVGVEPESSPTTPIQLARGDELARFEMGSTVVLILPAGGAQPEADLALGQTLRMGQAIARATPAEEGR